MHTERTTVEGLCVHLKANTSRLQAKMQHWTASALKDNMDILQQETWYYRKKQWDTICLFEIYRKSWEEYIVGLDSATNNSIRPRNLRINFSMIVDISKIK